MPSPTIAPLAAVSPIACAGVPAARKTRFWDRLARKYAADPIADMASDGATLGRVQGLLSAHQAVLGVGWQRQPVKATTSWCWPSSCCIW